MSGVVDGRHPFEVKLSAGWAESGWNDVTVMVAVSGGPDSVALLRGLLAIRLPGPGRILVAHFNHHLRGEASNEDQKSVESLAQRCGVPLVIGHADPPSAAADDDGIEAIARERRHAFLQAEAQRHGARYLVTAHTADDQAETILFRILRGTGISGVAGIRPFRPITPYLTLVHPMLSLRRWEVIEYLNDMGESFREDASNRERRFARNRIRHELLPLLADQYHPNVVESLLRLGASAGDAQQFVEEAGAAALDSAIRSVSSTSVTLAIPPLGRHASYMLRESLMLLWKRQNWPLQDMTRPKWEELANLAFHGRVGGTLNLPDHLRARLIHDGSSRKLEIERID